MGLLACVSGQRGVFPCATVWSPQSHSTMCAGNTLCISIKRRSQRTSRSACDRIRAHTMWGHTNSKSGVFSSSAISRGLENHKC